MVIQERKLVTILQAERFIRESNTQEEAIAKLHNLTKRGNNRIPPPQGGITYMDAERKYGINHGTISRWVKNGYMSIITQTANEVYIKEAELEYLLSIYKQAPGRGRPTLRHTLRGKTRRKRKVD